MNRGDREFNKLHALSAKARTLQGIASLLEWDQETYMPAGSAEIRAKQLELLASLIHKEHTSKKFSSQLSRLIDLDSGQIKEEELSALQCAALKEWRRDFLQQKALPEKFVKECARVFSQAVIAWRSAKEENAFHRFAPHLSRIVALNRKKADLLGYSEHPYDALLDLFEPGLKTSQLARLFSDLSQTLSPFIKELSRKPVEDRFLYGNWPCDKQILFANKVLDAMGYDRSKGRLDFSAHPFSSASHPTDSRITTRLHPENVMSNIFAVLHEAGHALYEMGLLPEFYGTPIGEARSLGIHESQSRFWETRIGLSKAFWVHFFPLLQETFPGKLNSIDVDTFYRAINKVKPSFIRIEADELTYPLHVVLRFELEKKLIEGSLSVNDIPEAWSDQMQQLLGISPKNDCEGCLQDIHWAMGSFGYFPSYTLGNLYAAELFDAFAHAHPQWEKKVVTGELHFIRNWLEEKIYRHGRQYEAAELIQRVTGRSFSAEPYLRYLKEKYSALYATTK